MTAIEANFDGLVGPTHNYAGLAVGNVASTSNRNTASNPRSAALQGLDKMQALVRLGVPQGVIPPQDRPHLPTLRTLGFSGTDAQVLSAADAADPGLLAACASASSMWVANAATVSPSAHTPDGRVHLSTANLAGHLHRSIEARQTESLLRAIFPATEHFAIHAPLPSTPDLGDEGAANHTLLAAASDASSVELFVYGRDADGGPSRFPARQTRAASQAIARRHGLSSDQTLFARQHPAAIDAGVFHNDVIAVGHRKVLLFHEQAFVDTERLIDALNEMVPGFCPIRVAAADVPLDDAVRSYLFNSQLVTTGDGRMVLVVARECEETRNVWSTIQAILADEGNPITDVHVADLRESMRNGGGPACLRLRVTLTPAERAAVNPACWVDDARIDTLRDWVRRHYREHLTPADLADPALLDESRTALDELSGILDLGPVYDFQQT